MPVETNSETKPSRSIYEEPSTRSETKHSSTMQRHEGVLTTFTTAQDKATVDGVLADATPA